MKRKLNEVDVPEAVNSEQPIQRDLTSAKAGFALFGLDPRLLQAVSRAKFSTPTLVQAKSIPLAESGKDILIRAKTGSGKTLAYTLPVLNSILRNNTAHSIKNGGPRSTQALILVPTKELAAQVSRVFESLAAFSAGEIRIENLSRKEDDRVTLARLAENPEVVVATPSRAAIWAEKTQLKLQDLRHLVVDEADLVLGFGYEENLRALAEILTNKTQTLMVSATLRTEVDSLTSLLCKRSPPEILDLSQEEAQEKQTLAHYAVRTAEDDKFLLVLAIFKLQLIKGKVIVFVSDIDRAYRVKLFLEHFGIRACVLNSELPVNSRLHIVEEFNRGVYDIIITADETEVVSNETEEKRKTMAVSRNVSEIGNDAIAEKGDVGGREVTQYATNASDEDTVDEVQRAEDDTAGTRQKMKRLPRNKDSEFGVSRGVDFRSVTCVLNFDLPSSAKSYTHRVGRTARAGKVGMALSFYVPLEKYRKHKPTSIPQCEHDEEVLRSIKSKLGDVHGPESASASSEDKSDATKAESNSPHVMQEWAVDWPKLDGLRYRFTDALRVVTRLAVREARTRELRQELINSTKLKRHFEENPEELRHLRHDREIRAGRQMPHLRNVPDYLLPSRSKDSISKGADGQSIGFVGLGKAGSNRLRNAREFNKTRGKGRLQRSKGLDPLKSLNARGRGKK